MALNQLYKETLLDLYNNGIVKNSRDCGECKEISPYVITLENVFDNVIKMEGFETNLKYAKAELDWYLNGTYNINYSDLIQKIWLPYSKNNLINSNYGMRIFGKDKRMNLNQFDWCFKKLSKEVFASSKFRSFNLRIPENIARVPFLKYG